MTTKTEFTASKKELISALTRAAAVAPKKTTFLVLICAKLEFIDGELNVIATDLYMAASTVISAKGKANGVIIAGARDLLTRVQAMPSDNVTISCDDACKITIKARGTKRRFTMTGIEPDSYPTIEGKPAKSQTIELTGEELSRLLAQTSYAASVDKDRSQLNAVFVEPRNGECSVIATNGHQISKSSVKRASLKNGLSYLVPLAAVTELRKLAEIAGKNLVTLCRSSDQLFVELGNVQFSSKLVDAQFPPYQQVIPDRCSTSIKVDRQELISSLQAVSTSAAVLTGGVRMALVDGALKIEAESPGLGEGSDEVQCKATGELEPIAFNSAMMVATLSALSTELVELGFSGELDPITVCPIEPKDGEEFVAVVMPMRL